MAKVKTKRINSLKPLWREYNRALAKRAKKMSEAVGAQIVSDAARFSRIGDSDEAVYTHLVGLMDAYRRVIDFAGKHSPESETVRVMISGICEVLEARQGDGSSVLASGETNPITAEKQAIIDDAAKNIAITGHETPEELYAIYRDALAACQARVDDLHSRKIARLYTELIEREYEELGNIINVQVAALKGTGARDTVIFSIADALGEAYQLTAPIVKSLQKPQKNKGSRPFEEFELPEEKNRPDTKKFFAALDAQTISFLDEIELGYKKAAYQFRRDIADEILLAKEITQVFEKLKLPEAGHEILTGISETLEIKIAGLNESIAEFDKKGAEIVKIFSDKKPRQARSGHRGHVPESAHSLEAGSSSPPDKKPHQAHTGHRGHVPEAAHSLEAGSSSPAHKKPALGHAEIMQSVREAWLANPPKESEIAEFFETCETLESCREAAKKHIETHEQTLQKASTRFKKDALLYEVCTFEEILTHSVPRLREDAGNDALLLSAALMLDDTFRTLAVILKKNNIEIIRPALKSQFNAREHEILVAEKNPDFAKGEIIKIMTAGYRFKGQVILRANVIAAR
ncbi:MAG: nucleotide exchange factor GrpE [Defluviitaleaceae bacterium]|nr:nucleotide exchange factor GrpE [Defluviitaleaceae bacterium]